MIQPETFGQRLHRLRVERGLSQRELSTPRVSYAYLSRLEHGQRTPSVKAIRELAVKLGVSAHYLETGDEDPLWTAWRLIERLWRERQEIRRSAMAARIAAAQRERSAVPEGEVLDLYLAVRAAANERVNRRGGTDAGSDDDERGATLRRPGRASSRG